MRKIASVTLLLLAALLAVPSVVLTWVQHDVLNQDRFVATVNQVVAQPAVQAKVADRGADAIVEHLPIDQLLADATSELPPKAAFAIRSLTPALDGVVNTYVHRAVAATIASDQFATVWKATLNASYQAFLKVLKGDASSDAITVSLGPIVDAAKTRLVDDGFELAGRIPAVDRQVTLYESPMIGKARGWFDAFNVLRFALPILVILLIAGAVFLARRKWSALMWAMAGIAAAMVVLLAATWIGRDSLNQGVAVYDAFIGSLRGLTGWVLAIAAILALMAFWQSRRATA